MAIGYVNNVDHRKEGRGVHLLITAILNIIGGFIITTIAGTIVLFL